MDPDQTASDQGLHCLPLFSGMKLYAHCSNFKLTTAIFTGPIFYIFYGCSPTTTIKGEGHVVCGADPGLPSLKNVLTQTSVKFVVARVTGLGFSFEFADDAAIGVRQTS